MIAVDTETYLFEPGCMAPKVVCLTWADGEEEGVVVNDEVENKALSILAGNKTVVGHNFAFDASVLMATYPELIDPFFEKYHEGQVHCTLIREKLLDIARGRHVIRKGRYTLAKIAERYKIIPEGALDEEKNDPNAWRLRYSELDGVPYEEWPKKAVDYAINDAVLTLAVWVCQEARAERMGYDLPDQEAQVRAHLALHLAGVWGVHTDPKRVEALLEVTETKMEVLSDKLIEAGLATRRTKRNGEVVFKKSTKELRRRVKDYFQSQGLPVPVTDKENVKADKEVLEEIDDPEIQVWQDFNGLQKGRSTYLLRYREGYELPIHARFNPIADTGRCSCSGPNWQNQPTPRVLPGCRECVIPRDGMVFIAADYDSKEMRTWAEACVRIVGWSKLAEAYQDDPDFDPHTALAVGQLISDETITYEEGLKRKKISGDIVEKMRQLAKIPNFGLPGGMGVRGLVGFARGYGEKLSQDRAKELIEAWRFQWPEALPYFEHIVALVGSSNNGLLVQLISGRWRGRVIYTKAANSYFQGLAADCAKAAMWEVCRRCYSVPTSALYGYRMWNFVHDEIILEGPEKGSHEAALELAAVMVEESEKIMTHVPVRASAAIMRRWYKKAEAVFDDSGRMIPWEPKK